ncbi:MAG: hypothetical protein GXO77_08345, partial [Calditrichaeota bacterium]|nr:hypothetical protein [Calditrichota bacterium]
SFDLKKLTRLVEEAGFKSLKHSKNLNKVFNRLHLSLFLKALPFPIWKLADRFFNLITDKPTSLILLSKK